MKVLGLVLLGILAFIVLLSFLLLFLPVKIRVKYDSSISLFLYSGILRMRVLPIKDNSLISRLLSRDPGKDEKKTPEKTKKRDASEPPSLPPLNGDTIKEYLSFALSAMGRLKRLISFPIFRVHALIATDDAYKTAGIYGRVCNGVALIYPIFRDNFKVKKCDISIDASFDKPACVTCDICVKIVPVVMLFCMIKILFAFRKLTKKMTPAEEKAAV